MSQHHYHAIGGVVTGIEPGFHELRADTSTLILWQTAIGASPKASTVTVSDVIVTGLNAICPTIRPSWTATSEMVNPPCRLSALTKSASWG